MLQSQVHKDLMKGANRVFKKVRVRRGAGNGAGGCDAPAGEGRGGRGSGGALMARMGCADWWEPAPPALHHTAWGVNGAGPRPRSRTGFPTLGLFTRLGGPAHPQVPWKKVEAERQGRERSEAEEKKAVARALRRDRARQKKIQEVRPVVSGSDHGACCCCCTGSPSVPCDRSS